MDAKTIAQMTGMTMKIVKTYEAEPYTKHDSGAPLYKQGFGVELRVEGRKYRLTWTKYEMAPDEDITPHLWEVLGGIIKRAATYEQCAGTLASKDSVMDRTRERRYREAADKLRAFLGDDRYELAVAA